LRAGSDTLTAEKQTLPSGFAPVLAATDESDQTVDDTSDTSFLQKISSTLMWENISNFFLFFHTAAKTNLNFGCFGAGHL